LLTLLSIVWVVANPDASAQTVTIFGQNVNVAEPSTFCVIGHSAGIVTLHFNGVKDNSRAVLIGEADLGSGT
jgi:hypothetical protein